jgi:hypothetical protein
MNRLPQTFLALFVLASLVTFPACSRPPSIRTAPVPPPSPSLVQNGGFEDGPALPNPGTTEEWAQIGPGTGIVKSWDIGEVGYVGAGTWKAPEGRRSISPYAARPELADTAGAISQTIDLPRDGMYVLRFMLSANPRCWLRGKGEVVKYLTVSIANAESTYSCNVSNFTDTRLVWTPRELRFAAQRGPVRLRFVGRKDESTCGAVIDDVSLIPAHDQ